VQTAVDSKHKLIVANDVTNDTGDRDWLSPMALQAKDILGSPFEAVADVGDYHGEDVKTWREAGLTPSRARPLTSAHAQLGLFSQEDCRYETMKRWWDAGYGRMRGLEQVRTACSWTVLAYHLRRVVHRVERPRLRAALGGDELGPSVVVRAVYLSGRGGSIARQASGC
jgi:hypothetical protein